MRTITLSALVATALVVSSSYGDDASDDPFGDKFPFGDSDSPFGDKFPFGDSDSPSDDDDIIGGISIGNNSGTLNIDGDGNGGLTINGKPVNSTGGVSISSNATGTYTISSQEGKACLKGCPSMFLNDDLDDNPDYEPCQSKCYDQFGVKQ